MRWELLLRSGAWHLPPQRRTKHHCAPGTVRGAGCTEERGDRSSPPSFSWETDRPRSKGYIHSRATASSPMFSRLPGKQEAGWSPSWSEYGRKGSRGSFLGRAILTDEQEQLGKARGRDEGRRKSSRCKSRISNAGNGTRFPYRMGRLASSFVFDESSRG